MLKSGMVRTLSDTKWFGSRFEGSLLGPYIFLGLFLGSAFKLIRIKSAALVLEVTSFFVNYLSYGLCFRDQTNITCNLFSLL